MKLCTAWQKVVLCMPYLFSCSLVHFTLAVFSICTSKLLLVIVLPACSCCTLWGRPCRIVLTLCTDYTSVFDPCMLFLKLHWITFSFALFYLFFCKFVLWCAYFVNCPVDSLFWLECFFFFFFVWVRVCLNVFAVRPADGICGADFLCSFFLLRLFWTFVTLCSSMF